MCKRQPRNSRPSLQSPQDSVQPSSSKAKSPRTLKPKKILSRDMKRRYVSVAEISEHNETEVYFNTEDGNRNSEETDSPTPCLCQIIKHASSHSTCEIIQDSGSGVSLVGSPTGSCDANARAVYYHSKLLSTLQILQNKEETIQVQAESLVVAEERILALTERAAELKRDLDIKSKELSTVRQGLDSCRVEKVEVSVSTESATPEEEKQSDVVKTLQSNLSIIEELYRECFYETAKQEDLIDRLRKSYLDVRLLDKQKTDQIGRLQNVIHTQKCSLDRCQDIALEVDNLKTEISNFLSSSASTNNDSGMWERSEESFASTPDANEDLQDIMEQLLRLRDILTEPCTCGLELENKRLKQENEVLQTRIVELCSRSDELEKIVDAKEILENKLNEDLATKKKQLNCVRRDMTRVTDTCREQTTALKTHLRETQVSLEDKSEELVRVQEQCDTQQETIVQLREELNNIKEMYKEGCKCRDKAKSARRALRDCERRARALSDQLRCAQQRCWEEESKSSELQSQLRTAHTRGATTCADVRRAVSDLRHWAHTMRREQETVIKEKEDMITALQERLQTRPCQSVHSMSPEEFPCPSLNRERSCSRCDAGTSRLGGESEMAGCSAAPTSPRRVFKKKCCGNRRCSDSPWLCNSGQQHPVLRDGSHDPGTYLQDPVPSSSHPVNVSPTDELFRRVEQLTDSLADGFRRWTRWNAR